MKVEQIRSTDGTGTLSYIVMDDAGSSALLIDPNLNDVNIIATMLRESGAALTHIVDTHTHADHISGAAELQKLTGARIAMHENTKNKWKVVDEGDKFGIGDILRANAKIPVDMYVQDDDVLLSGMTNARIFFTPGHTDNHIALRIGDSIFTGDLLLIGQAGRSDLPGGSAEDQYESLMNKILPLSDSIRMYPGHDYKNNTFSLLGNEKKNNPFLERRTKAEYVQFVRDFFPPLAEASASGGKMTLQCGAQRIAQPTDSFTSISPTELNAMLHRGSSATLLDVREPLELMTAGAIEGVQNISVRQLINRTSELPKDMSAPIVTLCASGSRSVEAAHMLQQLGYTNVMNLEGGTIGWIKSGLPVVHPTVKI